MKIVVSGGTGLIGNHLIQNYLQAHDVKILSTRKNIVADDLSYWNPEKNELDQSLIDNADIIINLAGAPVSKRWTRSHKQLIKESRQNSTRTLVNACNASAKPKHFISASAIGYYGHTYSLVDEDSPSGNDFLAKVCINWEEELKVLKPEHRLNIIRVGVVLAKEGGALNEMLKQFRRGLGSVLGNGRQKISWIHIDDICRMMMYLINSSLDGRVYNAVAPNPVSNELLTKEVLDAFKLSSILPPAPAFALRLMLGEMSQILLDSSNVSSKKIEDAGFEFKYCDLKSALQSLRG